MTIEGPVIIDTNLLLLLVVGSADRQYISKHKRLAPDYSIDDFDLVTAVASSFSDIILLPNTLTEVSSFARQIGNPARDHIQSKLAEFIEVNTEIHIAGRSAALRDEFFELGLTDAAILQLCAAPLGELTPTLLSVDADLLNAASALGYGFLDFTQLR